MHVARPRLIRRLSDAPVVLIEAGGGYGKSTLAAEYRRTLGIASAEAVLERAVSGADELIGVLRRGLRRAGLTDAAAVLTAAGVADERPLLLVVDEVQRASGEAVELLVGLATSLPEHHRLLLIGRRLDPRLRALPSVFLGTDDLAFDDTELAALLGGVEHVAHLRRVTQGWPAAAELRRPLARPRRRGPTRHPRPAARRSARGRLRHRPHPLSTARPPAPAVPRGRRRGGRPGRTDDAPRRRPPGPSLPPGLARTPGPGARGPRPSDPASRGLAAPGLVAAGLARRGLARARPRSPPRLRRPRAASSALARAARRGGTAYADAGELSAALALLSGDGVAVAELLAGRRWQELAALDLAELRVILSTLPEEALAAHPFALVQVARLADRTVDFELRVALLEQALALLGEGPVRREAEAELVATRAVTAPGDETEAAARAILAAAAPGETVTRARALTALARVDAWRGEPATMLRAEGYLAQAAALCRIAREPEWEAWTLNALGYRVAFARGDLDLAVEHMNAALALLPEPDSERAAVATFLAEALAYLGRLDDAESALREAAEIGRRLGDHRVRAYAAWTWTTLASLRGDAAATIQRIRAVERHPGDWFEHPTGAEFLADAALALARVGESEAALAYAERARERAEALGHPEIAWIATGAVEARFGDPALALDVLTRFAASPQQAPARRVADAALPGVRGLARGRPARGDLRRAGARGRRGARPPGPPRPPRARHRRAERAAGAGGHAARRVRRDRRRPRAGPAAGPRGDAGQAARPVRRAADRRGGGRGALARAPTCRPAAAGCATCSTACARRAAISSPATASRSCSRPRRSSTRGASRQSAAAVRSAAPAEQAGLARAALARYAGDLLPADRYEAWASAPRERLRRRYLDLLDLLSDDAVERGDLDEAIRLLDQAQVAEPLDESRYVRAAELLLFQGRRGSAAVLVERALKLRAGLGLPETPTLTRLRDATRT